MTSVYVFQVQTGEPTSSLAAQEFAFPTPY